MTVGILGLGLIGGSMARAYAKSNHTVYARERDTTILSFAQLAGIVSFPLDESNIGKCDFIVLAVNASGVLTWLEDNAKYISRSCLVIDCCGVKSVICSVCFALARQYGFTFIGGHPMAGSHFSGFKYSRSNLFQGAPMVLVPEKFDDPELLHRATTALKPCNFGSFSVTTAEDHDQMIAFTSQMPHILSNAFIKSPTAKKHKGFSAGSYKDLTRVAWLNSQMWAELFLSNKEDILYELETFLIELGQYKDAIQRDDKNMLIQLLEDGKKCKEEVDG